MHRKEKAKVAEAPIIYIFILLCVCRQLCVPVEKPVESVEYLLVYLKIDFISNSEIEGKRKLF